MHNEQQWISISYPKDKWIEYIYIYIYTHTQEVSYLECIDPYLVLTESTYTDSKCSVVIVNTHSHFICVRWLCKLCRIMIKQEMMSGGKSAAIDIDTGSVAGKRGGLLSFTITMPKNSPHHLILPPPCFVRVPPPPLHAPTPTTVQQESIGLLLMRHTHMLHVCL